MLSIPPREYVCKKETQRNWQGHTYELINQKELLALSKY